MTTIDTTVDGQRQVDVIIAVPQPTMPSTAKPADIGLVEISTRTIRGSIWFTGTGAPTDPGQQTGDMYLDTDTGDIYQWDGDSWEFQATFAPSTDTPAEVLAKLVTVDGAGSALDADLLDGQHGAYYATQMDMGMAQSNIANNASAISAIQTEQTTQNTAISNNTTAISTETTNRTNADTTLQNNINLKANIASPVFTGDPQAPTPATADNDTSIATTAYVKAQGYVTSASVPGPSSTTPAMDGAAAIGTGTTYARNDHVHPTDTSRAASVHTHAESDVTNLVSDLAARVLKAGDTMTGALTLNSATANEERIGFSNADVAWVARPLNYYITGTAASLALNTAAGATTAANDVVNIDDAGRVNCSSGIYFANAMNDGTNWRARAANFVGGLQYNPNTGQATLFSTAASVAAGAVATLATPMTLTAAGVMTVSSTVNAGTFSATGATAGMNCGAGQTNTSNTGTASFAQYRFFNANGGVGNITTNASATAFNTSSDERLKDFGAELTLDEAMAVIAADPVRHFTWIVDDKPAVGWSAQKSYAVSPDLASPPPDDVKDIAVGEEGFQPWGMDQSKRTPYLWAAMAGMMKKIEALEARIAVLEGREPAPA